MKLVKVLMALVLSLVLFQEALAEKTEQPPDPHNAFTTLKAQYPLARLYEKGQTISRVFGQPFGGGATPQEAAEEFRLNHSGLFGLWSDDLRPGSLLLDGLETQQVMYNRETGEYKFTLVYYSQYKGDIPVFRADLRLLFRNEPGYPLVLASSGLRNLGDFQADPMAAAADPAGVQTAFLADRPYLTEFSEPRRIIWAGFDDMDVAPQVGVEFEAWNGQPVTEKYLYIIEPASGQILYEENRLIDVNVTGQVRGNATEDFKAEQCGNEVGTSLPWARVYISSGSPFYADSSGYYTITNSGSTPVTVTSYIRGRFFQTFNEAGAESYLTQTVTPPGPANFLHNPSNTEYVRAEVNGYLHANVVRDFTLKANPTYPTIYNQYDFPVYVNRSDGYCPGNAWYDYSSINFCAAGSSYPNTAFSTIVHHEYGHHLVDCAGSGQGAYGEGMGDVMGLLITDDPGAAWGFYGSCFQALRNADNTMQYPCDGEIHYCGQLLSGCVWSTRNALQVSYPTTYLDILSNLAINAMLLHTGTSVDPDITLDYLTLDDNDGNIDNGTPHYSEICTGFGAHNMDCPPLVLLAFAYPNGKPDFVNPAGGTAMRVVVSALGATPQANSGVLHYNTGSGWLTSNMTQISPNTYDAIFPAAACGTTINYYVSARTTTSVTVNDPPDAPSSYFTTISGTGLVTIYQDNFSTNLGWTGLGGLGEWTIGVCSGGYGDDSYGEPDPTTDHSPTTDNKVLGNDLTSGAGGDYAPSLGSIYYATSPTINCAGQTNIRLSFWRWLGVERDIYDNAYFEVYNGSSWITLFENGSETIDETAWSQYSYDVSAYANNNANFRIRFGIGETDAAWEFCGWNIDDILVTAVTCAPTNGTITGTVTDSRGNINGCLVHAFDGGSNHAYFTTGANGVYSMSVPAGTYSLTFTQVDHRDTTLTGVVVTVNNTTTRNVVMQRLKSVVKGTVTSGPSQPLINIRVTAVSTGVVDTTNASGYYILPGITDGAYAISFTGTGYRDTSVANVALTPGDTTTLNVVMQVAPSCLFVAGDANSSGIANGIDVTYMVNFLKGVGMEPPDVCNCPPHGNIYVAGDVNGNCEFNGIDVSYLVNYLKGSGTEPSGCPDCAMLLSSPPVPALEGPGTPALKTQSEAGAQDQ